MDPKKNLKDHISKCLTKEASQEELEQLIQLTRVISRNYLKHFYRSFLKVCTKDGLSETDIINDAVSEVFSRDEEGRFVYLSNFSDSLSKPLQEIQEDKLFLAYQSFVQTVSVRMLSRTYAQVDRTGARIYRNIRDGVKGITELELYKSSWGAVLKLKGVSSNDHLEEFPVNKFEDLFFRVNIKNKHTVGMLNVVREILESQDAYRRSIPLFEVIRLFKLYFSTQLDHDPDEYNHFDFQGISEFDHTRIKSKLIQFIKQKTLTTYVITRKVETGKVLPLFSTLVSIIEEWFDDSKEKNPFYHHAAVYLKTTEEEYEKSWRTRIEYLIRLAREELQAYLMDGL